MTGGANAYKVGRAAETEVMLRARADGCIAWRCAGSKGELCTDVLVASVHTGVIALNVKRGCWAPPAERIAMLPMERFGVLPVLVHVDVVKGKLRVRYKVCSRELVGPANTLPPWQPNWLAQ